MDALKNLIANVPDWLVRLDELNGQIAKRQMDLSRLAEASSDSGIIGCTPPVKSIRNKGSTESLRPRDEPEAHPRESTPQPEPASRPPVTPPHGDQMAAPFNPSEPHSPTAVARQTNQVKAAGQARARATLRKRQRTDSAVSAEGAPASTKYRTRSMIIVYYDSYVQSFFEELVKFVSASRNMMRKAKMAAKVAQIKRLAELEMPDPSDEDSESSADRGLRTNGNGAIAVARQHAVPAVTTPPGSTEEQNGALPETGPTPPQSENGKADEELPALRYMSTRRMQSVSASPNLFLAQAAMGRGMYMRAGARAAALGRGLPGLSGLASLEAPQSDVYDELDKGLEFVQSMCEHAAHQFLRDGDCGDEVESLKRRLSQTKELADKEMDRVRREEPDALRASEEETRGRKYQPQSMRKELKVPKESIKDAAASCISREAEKTGSIKALEVDEGVEDLDPLPKLVYKSTRMMT